MRTIRICAALVVTVAALAACSTSATPGASDSTAPAVTATASPSAASTSSTARPSLDERPLQDLLPADFRGVEAHTFPVGQHMLARLATAIGVRRRALEAAFASDHGPAFVQMFALRVAGHDPQQLLDALPQAAYAGASGSVTVEPGRLGDHGVTVISEPTVAGTIGSFYAFIDGGTLIVAQALAEPVAEAAFEELPPQD